jgi:hypothetical protein
MMDALCCSGVSVHTYKTVRCYNLENKLIMSDIKFISNYY